jgi:hypothetical protein
MHIAQQITGLILAGFSIYFMLWFLAGTLRDSRTRYRHHVPTPASETESWQFRTVSPQPSSTPVSGPRNSGAGAFRPEPRFGHGLRPVPSSSR